MSNGRPHEYPPEAAGGVAAGAAAGGAGVGVVTFTEGAFALAVLELEGVDKFVFNGELEFVMFAVLLEELRA